jgi:hypothetical protein
MSILRLQPIPAAFIAAGIMSMSSAAFAVGCAGMPSSISGVYAQGTFAPTSYMAITRSMYATNPTEGATATGGYISILLKPTQTAWGYALSKGITAADCSGSDSGGTASLTHSLTTGTTSCTVTYHNVWDSSGTLNVSVVSVAASPATATTTCKTALANQTGLAAAFFTPTGSTEKKTFNLIY